MHIQQLSVQEAAPRPELQDFLAGEQQWQLPLCGFAQLATPAAAHALPLAAAASSTTLPGLRGDPYQQIVSVEHLRLEREKTLKNGAPIDRSRRVPVATACQQPPQQQWSAGSSRKISGKEAQPPMPPHSITNPTAQAQQQVSQVPQYSDLRSTVPQQRAAMQNQQLSMQGASRKEPQELLARVQQGRLPFCGTAQVAPPAAAPAVPWAAPASPLSPMSWFSEPEPQSPQLVQKKMGARGKNGRPHMGPPLTLLLHLLGLHDCLPLGWSASRPY